MATRYIRLATVADPPPQQLLASERTCPREAHIRGAAFAGEASNRAATLRRGERDCAHCPGWESGVTNPKHCGRCGRMVLLASDEDSPSLHHLPHLAVHRCLGDAGALNQLSRGEHRTGFSSGTLRSRFNRSAPAHNGIASVKANADSETVDLT